MDRGLPTIAASRVGRDAGTFVPPVVKKVTLTVEPYGPNQTGQRIHQAAEISLHHGPFAKRHNGMGHSRSQLHPT
jgi:hypothetical protein